MKTEVWPGFHPACSPIVTAAEPRDRMQQGNLWSSVVDDLGIKLEKKKSVTVFTWWQKFLRLERLRNLRSYTEIIRTTNWGNVDAFIHSWIKRVQCVCSIHLIQTNQTISKHLIQTLTFWLCEKNHPGRHHKCRQKMFSVSPSPVLTAWITGDQALRQHGFSWTGLKKGLNPATALVSAPMCKEAEESTAGVLQNDLQQMLLCMLLNKE